MMDSRMESAFRKDLLAEQVALITGGATGIGRVIARTLGQHGARVCLASRKAQNLERASKELSAEGIECMWVPCDVRNDTGVEDVVAEILEKWGRLDIVINNAAGNFPAPITGISYNGFKSIVDIDLRGTFNVTKAAFEAYLKDHGGHIVNISAPFQNVGVSLQAHVAAAKSGVDSLTRSCAVEFGAHNVRVNAVAPGATADTEGLDRFAAVKGAEEAACPLRRVGSKSDMANMVLFLVSDAASFVTGQVIAVDGGASVDLFKLGRAT